MESIREDRLGKALTWSLGAHAALALLVIVKSLVFPGEPILIAPALRVDVVGLPDLLKKDLSQVSKTQPKEDLVEKLQEAAKEAKKIEPIPAQEAPKPDELVLNPKKTDKVAKPEKESAADRQKRLDAALARIRSLDRLKDQSEEKEDAVIIKGNQISKGTSLSGDAREQANAGYYSLVQDALASEWALPPYLARQTELKAQVMIRIDPAGTVIDSKFIQESGNEQFDKAIRDTISRAQPLPKPPKDLQETVSGRGIAVGFPL